MLNIRIKISNVLANFNQLPSIQICTYVHNLLIRYITLSKYFVVTLAGWIHIDEEVHKSGRSFLKFKQAL